MSNPISFASRLRQQLQFIEDQMMKLLDISTIKEFRNDPNSPIILIGAPYYWGETDESQRRLQMQLKNTYLTWFEYFLFLFSNATEEIQLQIEETNRLVTNWIEKRSDHSIPPTIQEAKLKFREKIRFFYELIQMIENPNNSELILIPDTNALIKAPGVSQYSKIAQRRKYTVILVPTVLKELDRLKVSHRDQNFRDKVNSVIKRIKGLRQQGNLLQGVTVNKTITVKAVAREPNFNTTLHWLDSSNDDDRIIASTLEIQRIYPSAIVILVTSDINLQNKAELAYLPFLEPPD